MMSSNTTTSPLPLGEGASLVRTKGEHLAERVRAFACRPTIALTRNRCALSTSPDGRGGFSLVELSIVLVILGLLTGGILTGQNLIRAAELRSITTEFQAYQAAVNTFRDKYFALPGDMRNATQFWDEMTNCGAASPSGTGTQTCDGNGDGSVDPSAFNQTAEVFTFWQHLANAGLIEGHYTGITGATSIYNGTADNAPAAKINNGLWIAGTLDATGWSSSYTWDMDFGNYFDVTSQITAEEAWNIDTKMDDGRPGLGKVLVQGWDICTDAANDTDYTADFLLTDTTAQCDMRFKNAF